ncbi:hypothetical protein LINGRAHAP2_LOCUS14278, partial [Linum grandiflorum]
QIRDYLENLINPKSAIRTSNSSKAFFTLAPPGRCWLLLDINTNTMSSFNNTTPNFDNLLLRTLMGRLQVCPPTSQPSKSLEDLLFDAVNDLPADSDDEDNDDLDPSSKTLLRKEESRLEKEIIRLILSGNTDSLKPNSGQAVTIREHHICIGFHQDNDSDYRVWEWHGHIMLFDDDNGYNPEYIYGNYFERLLTAGPLRGLGAVSRSNKEDKEEQEEEQEEEEEEEEEEEKTANLGLRELIDDGESNGARILHRNIGAAPKA